MSIDKARALKNAQRYTQKGQFDKAVTEYLKLIETDPSEKTYKNFLGDLYLKQGNTEAAIRAFIESATVYQAEGFTPHTIALYKKILRIDPNRMELYLDLGKLYAEQGLVGDAITNFKIAADHYFSRGQKQQALKTYKNIVDLDPKNLNVKLRLAELYTREGMRGEAASQYASVAEKLAAAGKPEEAFTHYGKARELAPDNVDAIKGLIALCWNQEKFQDAATLMESLRVLEPNSVQNLLLLAKAYVKLGRRDAAIDMLQKVVAADPSQLQAQESLGRMYVERGDRTRAWNSLMPVIDAALNQNDRQTAGRLLEEFAPHLSGETGFLQKQYELAVQTADPAKRLAYGKRLAAQLEQAGAPDQALEIYQELSYLAPQDQEVAERVRSLAASIEPPRAGSGAGAGSLEIDLEQIDLSDLPEFGSAQAQNLDAIELPIELDLGMTPQSIPAVTSGTPPASRTAPSSSSPAQRTPDLVDVDLSGLDLGEGFGAEPDLAPPPAHSAPRSPAPARGSTDSGQTWNTEPARPFVSGLDFGGAAAPPPAQPARPGLDFGAPEVEAPARHPAASLDFGSVPLSELDLSLGEFSDAGMDVELELPIAPPAPPPKSPARAPDPFATAPPPRPDARPAAPSSHSFDLGELSDSVDAAMSESQLGNRAGRSTAPPAGRISGSRPAPPPEPLGPPSDGATFALQGGGGRDSSTAGSRRSTRAKSTALDQLNRLATPERSRPQERAKTPDGLKVADILRPPEPGVRPSERTRVSEPPPAFLSEPILELPVEPSTKINRLREPEPEFMPAPPPARAQDPFAFGGQPPTPSTGRPPDMLDISTDFFGPRDAEDSPGLIDLGDLILGDQPVAADDEENVNELLRQLREGIEAQVSKEDYDTHYNLGIAYKEMGLLDEAVDEFRRAAGDKARRVNCLSNIGLCYVQKGLTEQAIVEFRKGLADPACLDEDRVGLSYELGLVYEQQGETSKALEAFRIAARIDPGFRDVQDKLRDNGGDGDANAPKDRVSFL
jgi:tetratricopeptide (TPR) repeat protein